MTVEAIDIRIRQDGARVVRRDIDAIASGSEKAADSVDLLNKSLRFIGAGLVIKGLLELVNTFGNLQNRLRSTGLEGSNLVAVYDALLKVSNDTRGSVEGSIELYSRLAISAKELGVSQQQLIDFTKSLNQAISLSGASSQEAQAGLQQLSQGIASGTLRGDELRSVLEQLPAVADVIAKSLGVTRGQLRALGEDGKITAQAVLKAFQQARGELEERFAKTVPTIGQSFQVLKNNVLNLVGAYDQATGFSATLSKGLLLLSSNLDTVARAAIGVSSGLLLIGGAATVVRTTATAVQALTAAMAANPIGAFLVVMTSIITTLFLFRDQLTLGTDKLTTLGDFLRAFGEIASDAFGKLLSSVREAFGPLGGIIADWVSKVNVSFIDVIGFAAKAADTILGVMRGMFQALFTLFDKFPLAVSDVVIQGLNLVLDKIGKFVNKAGELLNSVTEFAGLGKIATAIDFTLPNSAAGEAKALGSNIAEAFSAGFNTSNPAQDFVNNLAKRAQEIGLERKLSNNPSSPSTVAGKAAPVPIDKKELEKATNDLRSFLNTVLPSSGAVLELAKAEKVLTEAQKVGLITQAQHTQYLALAKQYYEDTINPLGKINRDLDEQAGLLRLNSAAREVETQLLQTMKELQQQGIALSQAEVVELHNKYTAMQQLNLVTQAQDAIYAESIGKRKEFEAQLIALQQARATAGITGGDMAGATANVLKNAGLDIEGTQVAIDAQIAQFEGMYAKIAALREKDLISAQDAAQLTAKVTLQQNEARLKNTQDFFGNLATLSKSGNSKLAAIGRAAAIAQATIDGVLAVQKALASAPPPLNYALAAAVGVAAAANVSAIAKQGFAAGGYTGDMGTGTVAGVVHGKEFVNNAESTRVNRPILEAMNAGADFSALASQRGGGSVKVIINNNADGTKVRQEERNGPDGRELEVTIERVAARSVAKGGQLANAIESQYGLNRAQGSTY
jgi:tape measure domain-containing protein